MLADKKFGSVCYMSAPNISVRNAFTTRCGGVSSGTFESLNLGLNRGDDGALVRENYNIITDALGVAPNDIVCSRQVHGADIRVVTREDCGGLFEPEMREADGLITDVPGVALIVFTADCVPILLHDPIRGVIAAVHAGWRGTVADIAGKAVLKMQDEFSCKPGDINAAIGPCISKCCYETGVEVAEAVRSVLGDSADDCITPAGGKFMVDLKETNRRLLLRRGTQSIAVSDECTSCLCVKYWSHRKTGGIRGSQAAIIVM